MAEYDPLIRSLLHPIPQPEDRHFSAELTFTVPAQLWWDLLTAGDVPSLEARLDFERFMDDADHWISIHFPSGRAYPVRLVMTSTAQGVYVDQPVRDGWVHPPDGWVETDRSLTVNGAAILPGAALRLLDAATWTSEEQQEGIDWFRAQLVEDAARMDRARDGA